MLSSLFLVLILPIIILGAVFVFKVSLALAAGGVALVDALFLVDFLITLVIIGALFRLLATVTRDNWRLRRTRAELKGTGVN